MPLWLPPSAQIHRKEPQYMCALCGQPFFEGEERAYERHVTGHSMEEVQAHSPRHRAPGLYDPDAGDAEWAKWVREHRESDPHGWLRWGRTDDGKHSSGLGDG